MLGANTMYGIDAKDKRVCHVSQGVIAVQLIPPDKLTARISNDLHHVQ